jgi:hypothetical protein
MVVTTVIAIHIMHLGERMWQWHHMQTVLAATQGHKVLAISLKNHHGVETAEVNNKQNNSLFKLVLVLCIGSSNSKLPLT